MTVERGLKGRKRILEDHLNLPAHGKEVPAPQLGDIDLRSVDIEQNLSMCRGQGPADYLAQGRFSTTAFPDQSEALALFDGKAHIRDGQNLFFSAYPL